MASTSEHTGPVSSKRELHKWGVVTENSPPELLEFVKRRDGELATLTFNMWSYYAAKRMTLHDRDKLRRVIDDIYIRLLTELPEWGKGWKIVMTGSSLTGLAEAGNADIDACIHLPIEISTDAILAQNFAEQEGIEYSGFTSPGRRITTIKRDALMIAQRALDHEHTNRKRSSHPSEFELVASRVLSTAQVPLLQLEMRDQEGNQYDIDLAVSFDKWISSLYNSQLLSSYALFDPRVPALCLLIKRWSDVAGIRGGKKKKLNSYAICLLVIFFLQTGCEVPIVPNIQRLIEEFPRSCDDAVRLKVVSFGMDVRGLVEPIESPEDGNPFRLAELFVAFIVFYASFDFSKYYPSIKSGQKRRRSKMVSFQNASIFIEDPVDDNNPARTVLVLDEIRIPFKLWADEFLKCEDQYRLPNFSEIFGVEQCHAPRKYASNIQRPRIPQEQRPRKKTILSEVHNLKFDQGGQVYGREDGYDEDDGLID